MNMTIGKIFDIQHFSLGDGIGIRTTVFLKGCPLRCEWCHNPESQASETEITYARENCAQCGACAVACPQGCHKIGENGHLFNSEKCIHCLKCVKACLCGVLEEIGKSASVAEIISEVEEDMPFYENSGGGMTISGGEPLFQPDFTIALARAAKEKSIHVCIETSGFGNRDKLLELSKYSDLFLFDCKADEKLHKKLIGVDNSIILKNLKALDEAGAKIILRCPIIPEKNLTQAHVEGIIKIAKGLKNLQEINLLPYHNIATGKNEKLGKKTLNEKITPPSSDTMTELANRIQLETNVKTLIM